MTYAISYQTAMLLIIFSICLASTAGGILIGVWYQKRKSDEETQLLVTIWERLAHLRDDVDFLMSFQEDTQTPLRDVQTTQVLEAYDPEITQPIPTRNIL